MMGEMSSSSIVSFYFKFNLFTFKKYILIILFSS